MGEKKMLQKERKSPSQKKKEKKAIAPAIPEPRPYFSWYNECSCPSLFYKAGHQVSFRRSLMIYDRTSSRAGGITKSWISSSPACRGDGAVRQTWPQLVQINCCTKKQHSESYVYSGRVLIEPYCNDVSAEFINSIDFQGKCYAISLQGCLAVVAEGEITALGRNRAVPYCKVSRHFREYLFVYDGDIYLVFLLSRASINKVDGVEVFRLERSRLSWEKVDRLKGDAMFFLEEKRCLGISAGLLGCNSKRSNCVYFTHDRADGYWFVYHMETSSISPIPDSLF